MNGGLGNVKTSLWGDQENDAPAIPSRNRLKIASPVKPGNMTKFGGPFYYSHNPNRTRKSHGGSKERSEVWEYLCEIWESRAKVG